MDSVSLNIIIIGDTSVGKTTLMKRFIDGIFNEKILSTLGVELFRKQVKINDNDYVLKIWDTCGQERFRTLTKNYYKNAEGIMLLFDIHSIDSFQHLNNWMKSLNENFNGSDIPLVVVASKCDLEQMITDNEIEDYSNKNNVKIYKSSAKDNIQVEEPFLYLANEII
jgi:small GTP-binding protein